MNINDMFKLIAGGGNPEKLAISMLEQASANNPFMNNLLSLVKSGNTAQIEQIARNFCSSQGKDFDKEFNNFKQGLNIK